MDTIIDIICTIESDIFGQYKGIYKGSTPIQVSAAGAYGGKINLTINKGDEITVNAECLKVILMMRQYTFHGIWSIYALNPQRGSVFTITKNP